MKGLLYIGVFVSSVIYAGDKSASLHTASLETTPAGSQGENINLNLEGRRISIDLTPEKYEQLKSKIQIMKTEHEVRGRKIKCRAIAAVMGSAATLLSSFGYVVYAIKTCGVRD